MTIKSGGYYSADRDTNSNEQFVISTKAEGRMEKSDCMAGEYYVYILTNWNDCVMYIGVTNNLERRLYEHRNGLNEGFTKKYKTHKLVYFETTTDVSAAITREKQLKHWSRAKKNALVTAKNPQWRDLAPTGGNL